MNYINALVVAFCGVGLLLSIYIGNNDLASNLGIGLVGYLGGNVVASKE